MQRWWKDFPSDRFILLKMDFFFYSYRWRKSNGDRAQQSHGQTTSKALLMSYAKNIESFSWMGTAHHLGEVGEMLLIDNAGWHCSYCMSWEGIQSKLHAFAHREYAGAPYTNEEHIKFHMTTGRDLFDRPNEEMALQRSCKGDIPAIIRQEPDRFRMFWPELDESGNETPYPSPEQFELQNFWKE